MAISVAEAIKRGWLKDEPQPTKQREPHVPVLVKRLAPICERHGWQCGVYRAFCTSPESPQNTAETVAKPNAVVVWREASRACVVRLGWIWDVEEWSDEQVEQRLKELQVQG